MSTVVGESPTSLDDLVANPSLEEVWVNGPNQVFVAEGGVSRPVPMDVSAMDIRAFVERTLRFTGRRVDVSSPFADASLPDGSRLHVVIPDITREHWSINIRKFSPSLRSLVDARHIDAVSRTRSLIEASLSSQYSQEISVANSTALGAPTLEVTVNAPFPALGLWSAGGVMKVSAHAPLDYVR